MEKIYNFTTRAQVQPLPTKPQSDVDNHISFGMLLDIINPLQHLPVIGTIYRAITGDTAHPIARMIGGGLYGGFVGAALATADTMVKETSGKDTGQHILAALTPERASKISAPAIRPEPQPSPNDFQQAFLQYALTLQEKRSST